jgi:hypothetical protein
MLLFTSESDVAETLRVVHIIEQLAVYAVVAATIWWQLCVRTEPWIVWAAAAVTTGLLALLSVREVHHARHTAREQREAESGRAAVAAAERLRQRTYDLCAGLRLGFDICEECWVRHPDQAIRELDRLRAAVGQFVSMELGSPVSN